MKKILKKLNYQPISLSKTELKNPESVVEEFFQNIPIHEARANLSEFYKAWLLHSCEYAGVDDSRSMVSFYTQIIDFFNASFLCIEKRKPK